jgi:bromodomain-containing protein 7/9
MPLAQYVHDVIIDPITEGLHNVLRTTAQHLTAPTSTPPLSTPMTTQIDLSLHTYPQLWHTLNELKQLTSDSIDMAALIRLPAELFLSENEWAGARWKEEAAKKAEEERARSMGLWQVDGQGASEYLAFAIKSHQEAQAQGIENGTSGYVKEEPEMLQYVMDHAAKAIIALDARRQAGDLKLKPPLDDENSTEDTTQAVEDAGLRELRLNLLALAKRAPLDKIQRLPVDLVPEHIRHFVPTL